MDAVVDVLTRILDVLAKVFGVLRNTGATIGSVTDILKNYSVLIFLGGFFGLLLAFLWFFFRYLDKKRLALPAMLFTLFLLIFLGGNLLLIMRDTDGGSVTIQPEVHSELTEEAAV